MSQSTNSADWCDRAKKLLSIIGSDNADDLVRRKKEVVDLLGKMKAEPTLKDAYFAYQYEYDELSNKGLALAVNTKNGQLDKKKARPKMVEISQRLGQMKDELRLKVGAVDPLATTKVQEAVLDEARNKPVYDDKRERINAAIVELNGQPGAKKQADQLQKRLNAAKILEPDYEAAYKALSGLTKTLKEGREKAEKFSSSVGGKEFQKKLTEATAEVDRCEEISGSANPEKVDQLRDELNAVLEKLDLPGKDINDKVLKPATAELNRIIKDSQTLTTAREKLKTDAEGLEKKLQPKIDDLGKWASAKTVAPLLNEFRTAQSLAGTQQFERAITAYTALDKKIDAPYQEYKGYFDEWKKTDDELRGKYDKLLDDITRSKDGVLQSAANPMSTLINRNLRSVMIPANQYKDAVGLVKKENLLEDLKELEKAWQASQSKGTNPQQPAAPPTFKNEERNFRFQIGEYNVKVQNALLAPEPKLGALAKAGGFREPYDARRDEIRAEWAKAQNPATDAKTALKKRQALLPGLKKTCDDFVAELSNMATEIDNVPKDAKLKAANAENKKKLDASQKLTADQAAAKQGLAYLEGYGLPDSDQSLASYPDVKSMRKELADLLAKKNLDEFDALSFAKLAEAAAAKRKDIDARLKKLRDQSVNAVEVLRDNIEIMAHEAKEHGHEAYFESLRDKLIDCQGLASSTTMSSVEAGAEMAKKLQAEIKALQETMKKDDQNYKAVDKKREELKATLEEDVIKEYQAASQATLSTRLKKVLPDALKPLSPADALKALAEFQIEVDAVKKLATEAKENREKIGGRADAAEKELADIEKKTPDLYASLKKRIEAARKPDKGREDYALADIEAVRMLTADAKKDDAKAKELERNVQKEALKEKRDQAEFKAARDVFEKNGKRQADEKRSEFGIGGMAFTGECNTDVHDEMTRAFNQAQKMADSKDYEGAKERLSEASRLAQMFLANPLNAKGASRKILKKLNTKWKEAVSEYLKELTDLKKDVVDKCTADPAVGAAGGTKAAERLDRLASLFDATMFDDAITLLSRSPKPENEAQRSKKKETALLHLRRYQRTLKENPLLKIARQSEFTPFSTVKVTRSLNGLSNALLVS